MRLGESRQTQIFTTKIEKAPMADSRLTLTGIREIQFSIALKLSQSIFKSHAEIFTLL